MADSHAVLIADAVPNLVPKPTAGLNRLGYDIITVGDPASAEKMAVRLRPAVAVLSPTLPAGGAIGALRRLRCSVHAAAIPVVALSTRSAEKQSLLNAGADAVLDAPVSSDELLETLTKYLTVSRPVTEAPAEVIRDPERLATLKTSGLLDGGTDEELDLITRLASQILEIPVSLVSLVDANRQVFKSQVGVPLPWSESGETPLSHSFCQWVVSSHQELVVADARFHETLRLNRAITDLGVVAYAGIPLSAASGQALGSFCAIDGHPHSWNDDELATLRDFAQIVEGHVALNYTPAPIPSQSPRFPYLESIMRATGHSFLAMGRMLRREKPLLTPEQRLDIMRIIERQAHRQIEIAETKGSPRHAIAV